MMRQSLQAVSPEISGNKTLSLRKSVCSDLLTLFNSPHSALPSLLVSGMPEWQVHNQSDKHLQSWYCRQLRSALLFHEPRIAALQVNLKGNIDIVSDLSTLFCGFNPKRVFNGYVFLGGGLNRGFDNDEANALDTRTYEMEYLWQDGKFLVAGRMGLGCNLRLNDRLSINIEGNANVLSDKFNSKKAGNADWQFNALIGLNIKFGKGYTETKPVYYEAEPVVVEQPKPAPVVEQPQPKKEVVVQPMKQDIFFALNSAKIQDDQKSKIDMLVEYLQNNPAAKVKVTGYADVNTGNPKINKSLSEKRAGNVADALKAKGITTDRIMVDSKGDTVQPYKAPEENRVSICIAE